MLQVKGEMSILEAVIRTLKGNTKGSATWGELYKNVPLLVGYKVGPDVVRAVVYRKMPTRHKKPAFKVQNIHGVTVVKLLDKNK
jgi:hypothetical protein